MKSLVNLILVLILVQCKSTHNKKTILTTQKTNEIIGIWKTNLEKDEINYPMIIVNDKHLVLTSKADTLYRYKYRINKDTLFLMSFSNNKDAFRTKYELNSKKLILDSLPRKNKKYVFFKLN